MPSIFDKFPPEVRKKLIEEFLKTSPTVTGRIRRGGPEVQNIPFRSDAHRRSEAYRRMADALRRGDIRIPVPEPMRVTPEEPPTRPNFKTRPMTLDDLIGKQVHIDIPPLNAKTAVLLMDRNAEGIWEWRGRRSVKFHPDAFSFVMDER